ncbi:TPA: LOW QUALITY PROTEIN: hypothetical protein N0F65_005561 [Lagenidium giganteum]|uniref:Uncharacterized protein n=1 Tax=Lagenidium giganteum TaxID=4803 RepID=A0AAV2YYI2_9STRA|nr:TPA: LOW QUALITY PROTEIN: hypothetical protein N0F65_005561 [Lagenidium giganteum]
MISMPSGWQKLSKCQAIGKSKNWGVQTGKRSGITVVDVDIKKNKNGMDSLLDVDIDLDDYQTYKWRISLLYDERFKTSANVLPGVDVRNDNGCVFAGERYEVVNDVDPVDMPEELYEALYQCKKNTYTMSPILDRSNVEMIGDHQLDFEINHKYYDLIKLLPRKWFNDHDKWMKPAYAIYNCSELDKTVAFSTWIKLLRDFSDQFNEREAKRCWNELRIDVDKPCTLGTIRQVVKREDKDGYQAWCLAYPSTSKSGGQSAKVLADAKRIDDIKAELFQQLCANIEQIDANLIRDANDIEFNTLLMNDDEAYNVEDLALLLRQTTIRVENNGDAMFYVKEINETKYKRQYVASIRFEYKFDIEYKDEIFSLKLLNILPAVMKSVNYKKVVLEPYGAFDSDDSSKRRNFNLFSGLLHKYENDFVADNSIVDVWLTHLTSVIANNDEPVYNYLLKYFKHILVNPMEKTGTVIIIKVDNSDRAVMSKFKNLITADEVQIEYKGKEPVTLSDFCNYIEISNNDFASFIEESDRRSLCLETNNMMIGNRSYFNIYWAADFSLL